jgi:hypothetical protein
MGKYAKAIVAGLIAGLTALAPALDGGVSGKEWIAIALATLAGLGVVYAVPNRQQ